MNLKESFANKGLIINDLKRYWWTICFQLLIFTICIPFNLFQASKWWTPGAGIALDDEFMLIASVGIGVVLSMLLFGYMHIKKSNILIHSLPIRKEAIYNSHIISGLILMIVPIVVNLIISIGSTLYLGVESSISLEFLLSFHFIIMLIEIMMFILGSAVASFTGFTIAQALFTGVVSVLAIALGSLINLNLSYWIYGYPHHHINSIGDVLMIFSPVNAILELGEDVMAMTNVIEIELSAVIYTVALIVVFYVVGLIAYKKRKTEKSEILIAFKWLEPIFKYGFVFSVMLSSVTLVMYKSVGYVIFTYIVSSFIAYLVANVFIKKSISAMKEIKGYAPYVGVIAIGLLIVNLNIFGYEDRIPEVENIKSAFISYGYYESEYFIERHTYNSPKSIEAIRDLHVAIIRDKEKIKFKDDDFSTEPVAIIYNLDNGKVVTRFYEVPGEIYHNKYSEYYDRVYSNEEYKKKEYEIFDVDEYDIDSITIESNLNYNKRTIFIDRNEILEILSIVKEDILNMTPEEMKRSMEYGDIEISFTDEYVKSIYGEEALARKDNYYENIPWKKSFDLLNQYLNDNEILDSLLVTPEEVEKIIVSQYNQEGEERYQEIYDKEVIEKCLEMGEKTRSGYRYDYEYYNVRIHFNNGEVGHNNIRKEIAPEFIKEYFEK